MSTDATQMGDEVSITLIHNGEVVAEVTDHNSEENNNEE